MTLPASGTISISQVSTELGRASNAATSLNETPVRSLFGIASGAISLSNGYGKSSVVTVTLTVSSNIQNFNVYSAATGAVPSGVSRSGTYVAGATTVSVVINSGIVVGSSSTGAYAFDTGTGWAAGDTISVTNNGYIVGCGGSGNGGVGGPALRAQRAMTMINNGTVGGGGGAGGAGGYLYGQTNFGKGNIKTVYAGGGGGGGGAGYNAGAGGANNGQISGSVGYSGGRPAGNDNAYPGAAGSLTAGGAVGPIYGLGGLAYTLYNNNFWICGGSGGAGGSLGAAGAAGNANGGVQSGISPWGYVAGATAGGAGGAATNGNGFITWTTTGTRLGTLG